MEKTVIEGVEIYLAAPDDVPMSWVGQHELVTQVLAAWLVIGDDDFPLNPRLVGKPGVGKTTLAYHAGKNLNLPVALRSLAAVQLLAGQSQLPQYISTIR